MRNRWRRVAIIFVSLILFTAAAASIVLIEVSDRVHRMTVLVQAASADAEEIRALAQEPDLATLDAARLEEVGATLRRLQATLGQIQAEEAPFDPLLSFVATRSELGDTARQAGAVRPLLSLSYGVVSASALLADAALPVLSLVDGSTTEQAPNRSLETMLQKARPSIVQAQAMLRSARQERALIDRNTLNGRLARAGSLLDLYDRHEPALAGAIESLDKATDLLPSLLGFDRPKTYLVLGQNNDEFRVTGGFIGSMGTVVVDHARIVQIDYRSSYEFDNPSTPRAVPPEPFERYMAFSEWHMRDANWWADFRSSALEIERMWVKEQGAPIDGIIAADRAVVEELLRFVGPVELPAFGFSVDHTNVWSSAVGRIQALPAGTGPDVSQHEKGRFLAAVMREVLARVEGLPPRERIRLAQRMATRLDEKHALVAFHDPGLAAQARALNWDGAILSSEGDYLYATDTTLSYSEVYQHIRKSLHALLQIDPDSGTYESTLTVSYQNSYGPGVGPAARAVAGGLFYDMSRGIISIVEGYWGNWLRVFIPADAELISVIGLDSEMQTYEEAGRRVVAGYVGLRPGEPRSVTVRYRRGLPAGEMVDRLRLLVQKQPGSTEVPFDIVAETTSGNDLNLIAAGSQEVHAHRLTTSLLRDLRLDIVLPHPYPGKESP
ncbi:MAG: uncharacterized protein HW416_316 [Chloroflexi bacterium]|nr:uncharacterized protein [Chloroflexota bacterium]